MALSLQVHRFTRGQDAVGKPITVLVQSRPYLRITGEGAAAPIFVQAGRAYSEGGDQYKLESLPPWFEIEAAKIDGPVARETGLDQLLREFAADKIKAAEAVVAEAQAKAAEVKAKPKPAGPKPKVSAKEDAEIQKKAEALHEKATKAEAKKAEAPAPKPPLLDKSDL